MYEPFEAPVRPAPTRVIRLIHKADFERLLGTPAWSRSAHFSVHHVAAASLAPVWTPSMARADELSTESDHPGVLPVDNIAALAHGFHLGAVVPKRHAKRAVTRSLIKRQIRATFASHAAALPAGQWLVRLRQPFAPAQFVSARSPALQRAAQQELNQLFSHPNPQRSPRRTAPAA
jgi:ribonuclease P protein component